MEHIIKKDIVKRITIRLENRRKQLKKTVAIKCEVSKCSMEDAQLRDVIINIIPRVIAVCIIGS